MNNKSCTFEEVAAPHTASGWSKVPHHSFQAILGAAAAAAGGQRLQRSNTLPALERSNTFPALEDGLVNMHDRRGPIGPDVPAREYASRPPLPIEDLPPAAADGHAEAAAKLAELTANAQRQAKEQAAKIAEEKLAAEKLAAEKLAAEQLAAEQLAAKKVQQK